MGAMEVIPAASKPLCGGIRLPQELCHALEKTIGMVVATFMLKVNGMLLHLVAHY